MSEAITKAAQQALEALRDSAIQRPHGQKCQVRDAIWGLEAALSQAGQGGQRDREQDRARYPDPDFNRWLDESITENGEVTVWHALSNTGSAYAGWSVRPSYAGGQAGQGGQGAVGKIAKFFNDTEALVEFSEPHQGAPLRAGALLYAAQPAPVPAPVASAAPMTKEHLTLMAEQCGLTLTYGLSVFARRVEAHHRIGQQPTPVASVACPEDIEAIIACLGDDAATLRDESPEIADNLDAAAEALRTLSQQPAPAVPAVPAVRMWDTNQIAMACVQAEICDGHCESLLLALESEPTLSAAPKPEPATDIDEAQLKLMTERGAVAWAGHEAAPKPEQAKHSTAFAGVHVWMGEHQVLQHLTLAEIDRGACIENTAGKACAMLEQEIAAAKAKQEGAAPVPRETLGCEGSG